MIPEVGDTLVLDDDLPGPEQEEVTIVAIDTEQGLFTVYSPTEDECYVLMLRDSSFVRILFDRKKEPWES